MVRPPRQREGSGSVVTLEASVVPTNFPVVVVLLLAAGCGTSSKSSTPTTTTSSTPPATSAAGALKIAGFAYDPKPLTVAPGAKIPVTNSDSAAHTVTSDVKGLFSSGNVDNGQTVTFTAPDKAGTYTFTCAYHPRMHGTLVVKG
ncbi:MAG: blue (type 1) copper domain protein [Frankiales bacterium]|nr:blue (type 1) copper domain protein [Frankiales bacterium]